VRVAVVHPSMELRSRKIVGVVNAARNGVSPRVNRRVSFELSALRGGPHGEVARDRNVAPQ